MIRPSVRVTVTQNRIPGLSKRLQSLAGRNSEMTARGIAASYQARVHVITGQLRDSIDAIKTGPYTWVAGSFGLDPDYSGFEEFGTIYRPAHPAFVPAVVEWQPKFLGGIDRLLDELV